MVWSQRKSGETNDLHRLDDVTPDNHLSKLQINVIFGCKEGKKTTSWTGWSQTTAISFMRTAADEALPSACSTLIAPSLLSGRSHE